MEFERTYGRVQVVAGPSHQNVETIRRLAAVVAGQRLLILVGAHVQANPDLRLLIQRQVFPGRIAECEVVPPFPSRARVERMIALAREVRADGVVAFGGGSVIDSGKTVAVVAPNPMSLEDAMAGHWQAEDRLPLGVVPTLFGSGSEVTPFSVLFANEKKYSLDHPLLQPDVAAIVPRWGLLPPAQPAAAAYLDMLCQSIESLWSVKSSVDSERYAWDCLRYLMDYRKASTIGAKYDILARASLDGGCAIGMTRTTLAHALSYPLTIHHDVSHGIACAVFLPAVLAWNAAVIDQVPTDCTHPLGAVWLHKRITDISTLLCGRSATATEGAAEIRKIAQEVGVRLSLRQLGIPAEAHAGIAGQVGNPERLGNNPRRVTPEAIAQIIAASAEPKD